MIIVSARVALREDDTRERAKDFDELIIFSSEHGTFLFVFVL
jgi:hypothetical protein